MNTKMTMGDDKITKRYDCSTYALSNEDSHRLTIESIEEAMLLLLEETSLSKITITDIVKKAGVSRGAFYRNYTSKEDILHRTSMQYATATFLKMHAFRNDKNASNFWIGLFDYAMEHRSFYELIAKNDLSDIFIDCTKHLVDMAQIPEGINKYSLSFMKGAVSSVFGDWIENGMKETPEEMANYLAELTGGIQKISSGSAS